MQIRRPGGLALLSGNSRRPIPAPKFCGRGRALPRPQTHLPAPRSLPRRAHNESAQSRGAIGLLLCLKHAGLTGVRALTSLEFA